MNRAYRAHCYLFDCLLTLQSDELFARYGEEMRSVFEDELSDAWQQGTVAIIRVWLEILAETITLIMPRYVARVRLLFAASALATAITVGSAFGFCTLGPTPVVHASVQGLSSAQSSAQLASSGSVVPLPDGHHMYLECSGDPNARPTVILANGKGLGTADAWVKVQQLVPLSIRTCSYDAIGAGRSDHIQEPHPELSPIDQVVAEMHELFEAAHLKQPYVLAGASAGGILIRRYQQQYPREVAGLVFVDSAHEEQVWRIAAISKDLDPNWNNPESLRANGFLPDSQKLTWHADIPLIVLERTEKPPRSAFPSLNEQQFDALNAEWHNHQVDLASRSKYGQLRAVAGAGHFMHQQRPDAIAEAIQDVVRQANAH
ncbi:alpha/beta fold hydrolase [Acidicapsa dinghuensis]|uniref:Alpha/beta fold hydrolase n=1 Tax=Acidicapsa dinghuensis TaxID=2218256 RepID=A0ABW1E9X8_9BACT|nr:alpha/beta hydrolase [Acidicapsa dinghuensis]